MLRLRHDADGQRGQILVLFALAMVGILLFASIVVDLGVLRNNRQILVNAVDSAALAGGTVMPVDGSVGGAAAAANNLVTSTLLANYPSLTGSDYSITYRCLIGADPTTGAPLVSRDVPGVCNPANALGHAPVASDFIGAGVGAGASRYSICNPAVGDKCNVVVVTATAISPYSFGRVVGITSGSTGAIMSAACNGPCGAPAAVPLDVVLIIDRTGSMAGDEANLEAAANAVLSVYDPAIQRVALGTLGPSAPSLSCPGVGSHALPLDVPPAPSPPSYGSQTNTYTTNTAASLALARPSNVATGDFLLAQILYNSGSSLVVTPPAGWTLVRRTDDGAANLGQALYYKYAVAPEPATWTWTFGASIEAAGGVLRYTGVDPSNPFDPAAASGSIGTGNNGTGTGQVATGLTTTTADTRIVAFFGHENDTSMSTPGGMSERYERQRNNTGTDLAVSTDDVTLAAAGSTGNKTSNAGSSDRWIAQLVALRAVPPPPPGPDDYGTDLVADLSKWIPVGLSGIGAPVNEAYRNPDLTLNTSSQLVNAVSCASNNLSGTGTNLATPIAMARAYLQTYGRVGVKQGIIFETDGQPNYNGLSGDPGNYTCAQALTNADAAKADGIIIYTIGFDLTANCPDGGASTISTLGSMATGPINGGSACNAAENSDGDHFFCEPAGTDLTNVFKAAAEELAGLRSHLVQPYPLPIVTGIAPTGGDKGGGTGVVITGQYFSGATVVRFGGTPAASFTVVNDTTITATSPAGAANAVVHITVTTPGLTGQGQTSPAVAADLFTYGP